MNKLLKISYLLLAVQIVIFSCKHTDTAEPETNVVFEFKGEMVSIPANFPQNLFNQSQEDFRKYYMQISGDSRARTSNPEVLTNEEMFSILQEEIKKYPKLSYEEKISENDLKRIFKDIPSITNSAQAQAKIEVIFEYYETLMKYSVTNKVATLAKSKKLKNARINSPSDGLSPLEQDFISSAPVRGFYYMLAGNKATNNTEQRFPINGEDNQRGNAFKHSAWNALAIRYIIIETPTSEDNAISFVRTGTSLHEYDIITSEQVKDDRAAMDLHNNMSGRTWMKDETRWGIGPLRRMPNDNRIMDYMEQRANSAPKDNLSIILAIHGGGETAWNRLYNDAVGPYYDLVYILD